MWEKLNNSSLLFSKNFYLSNESNFYLRTSFINKLYYYYCQKGYYNIISTQIVNLLISNFMILFIMFLVNCVNIVGILKLDDHEQLGSYIHWNQFFNMNYFMWSLFIVFLIFTCVRLLNLIDDIFSYHNIRLYYKTTLKIRDSDLEYLEWNDIIETINYNTSTTLNIFYINSIINSKENYLISLFDNKIIDVFHINSLIGWNIIYCILYSIFDSNYKVDPDIFSDRIKFIKRISDRMKAISIINFIFMPFILLFILFYYIFNYGEKFYNDPNLVVSRVFTNKTKWKFRNYNELNHEFDKRIECANKHAKKYAGLFSSKLLETFTRLIVFIASSFFIVLLVLSIINDSILVNLYIANNKTVLWFLGILAPIIALGKNIVSKNIQDQPKDVMQNISEHVSIDSEYIEKANFTHIKNKFFAMYEYKIYTLLKDIFYTIISPFELWTLSYEAHNIMDFIIQNTETHDELLFICKQANFDNLADLISEYNEYDKNNIPEKYKKKLEALKYFKKNYPEWYTKYEKENRFMNTSVKVNII